MTARRTILVVDDNSVNRTILCKILSTQYTVIQAENGKQALEILENKQENISAVLLDLIMPVMDGYEFLKKKQNNSLISNIPVIVTTQKEGTDEEIEVLSRGASDFLTKPYNAAIIQHRLANLIKLRETVSFVYAVERDILTGLYNKEAFYEHVGAAIRNNAAEYDLICMDIENFKLINDMYGEAEGDKLLLHIAEFLCDITNPETSFLSRLFGDVFAVIVPRQSEYQTNFIDLIRSELKNYPLSFHVVMRFGIYEIDDKSLSVRAICDRARLAIQSIKGKYGKYCAYYDDKLRKQLLLEQKISGEMKEALLGNQFHVYFQPKYSLETEEMIGAEALVRWEHPTNGFMPPDKFIPLFEKNGFITEMDIYVWEKACQMLRKWIDMGLEPIPVSVNVSRVDIYNPKLPEILCGIVQKYGLEPQSLHLEITETAYTESPQQLIQMVSDLKSREFVIEMDDFGSGYSSLNMLNEVPVDLLKLDMRFLQNNTTENRSNSIINFVIRLAEGLKLSVIAEGIETKEDFSFLQSMGCTFGQGYYFAKPLSQVDFEKLLAERMQESVT